MQTFLAVASMSAGRKHLSLEPMKLHIKNMVCDRCKMVVAAELAKLGIIVSEMELGEVVVDDSTNEAQVVEAKKSLERVGFQLLDDQKQKLVEGVKNAVVEMIHYQKGNDLHFNYSNVIAAKLNKDYTYLSNLFSEIEGTTIEKYIICQRIERAKELLEYGEQSLTEIAYELGYSSVAYLSNQFKKVTGYTPSVYKGQTSEKRKPLDKI